MIIKALTWIVITGSLVVGFIWRDPGPTPTPEADRIIREDSLSQRADSL
jgi:hypothetical protein